MTGIGHPKQPGHGLSMCPPLQRKDLAQKHIRRKKLSSTRVLWWKVVNEPSQPNQIFFLLFFRQDFRVRSRRSADASGKTPEGVPVV